jgi:catechol 2,3-dioxygenase-like lactoylglutathione lyase family enzyme
VSAIHHIGLEVRRSDVDACARFFALLDFERVEVPERLGDTVWVERDGQQVHLQVVDDPVVPTQGHVAVVCRDYERTLAALRDAGFAADPRQEYWGSPRSFVDGPGGHRVEVMAFPPGG